MLALGIHYLNGWAMAAADGANKGRAEWPPHPDRIFMALAAAWFETGEPTVEGEALTWLEGCGAPLIAASDASLRSTGSGHGLAVSYVPVNDLRVSKKVPDSLDFHKLKDAGLTVLPEYRVRQARSFPTAIPRDPNVYLIWPDAEPAPHLDALHSLARKVTNLGHSASLVQMWIETKPIEPRWYPTDGPAEHRLRVTSPGRLRYLRERYNRDTVIAHAELKSRISSAKGKEKTMLKIELQERYGDSDPVTLRPEPSLWRGYSLAPPESPRQAPGSLFDPRMLVLTLYGHRLSLPATLRLSNALRCTLLKEIAERHGAIGTHRCDGTTDRAPENATTFDYPEWLCGHDAAGAASRFPHLAFAPLAFTDAAHADGRILGIAMVLPRGLNQAEAGRWLEPWLRDNHELPREIRLFDGRWLETSVEIETRESRPWSLRTETWTAADAGASLWASVTPVVLDRHFKGADKWQKAVDSIKDACERVGLPRPVEVELHPVSKVRGAPRSEEFPYLTRKSDGGRMHHAHALLQFAEPVVGPILIGAGRFRGYGFCRPLDRHMPENRPGGHHG